MPDAQWRQFAQSLFVGLMLLGSLLEGRSLAQARMSFRPPLPQGPATTITGTLSIVVADDLKTHRAELIHSVRDDRTGQNIRLRFERSAPADLHTGSRVTARGREQGSELYLASSEDPTMTAQALDVAPQTPVVAGDQRTLVIVANFRDSCVSCTLDAVHSMMFADPNGLSVDALYRETSRNQVSFSGTVVGPYTIEAASTDVCDYGMWGDAAEAQALAAGIDVAAYPRKLYVMPRNTCPGSGFGTLGGTKTGAWVFECQIRGLYAHELGHNLGMNHASTPGSVYGDTTDAMGLSDAWLTPMNAPHRQQMGWLGPNSVATITQSGTYDVAPLAVDPSTATAPQVLTMVKQDTGEHYYLSYRHALGFDNYVDGSYRERLNVHRYSGDGTAQQTFLLASLLDGESFIDEPNGIQVTLIAHDGTHATFQVGLAAPTPVCTAASPMVAVTPQSQTGPAGSARSYAVSVTNQDAGACATSAFTLTGTASAGWTVALTPAVMSVAPGTSAQAMLSLTSSTTAPAGSYEAIVTATDSAVAGHTASALAWYAVSAPCTPHAPTISVSPGSQSGVPGTTLTYSFVVTSTDSSACAPAQYTVQAQSPTGWSSSSSVSSMTLASGQSGAFMVLVTSPITTTTGNYSLATSVFDAAQAGHAGSASASYAVLQPKDTSAPSAPTSLAAVANQKLKQIQLSWGAATDDVGVTGYSVLRDGVVVAMVTTTKWSDPAFTSGATYRYIVVAYDAAGNGSASSNTASVTISGVSGGKKR